MILSGFAEPEDECREVESGPVAGGECVEAGGDGAELLEPVEAAFYDVAGLVELAVEGRRPAAGPAAPYAVGLLAGPFRDHRPDAPAAQALADRP
jgi:hypothetical protein